MELDGKLIREVPLAQQMFLSDNYSSKAYMKDHDSIIPFESAASSKGTTGFLQDFHHLDHHFHASGSSSNPIFGVQTGSNFDSLDAFPYGSLSNIDLYEYECKPFAADDNGGHGQVMDNFQCGGGGGGYMNLNQRNPIDLMGSNHMSINFQDIKPPLNFVVPDEVSCVTAKHDFFYKKVGMNKNRALAASRRTWKSRKKNNVVKGQWTIEEDRLLIQLVEQYGVRKWSHIAQMLPGRIGKQCRERWHNHLRPDIKKDIWSEEEDKVLIEAHAEIGNKWAEIAKRLPGRTENSIKNHWNATKRRQYSKRKCRSKYPRGSLLQEYIKSLNLDAGSTATSTGKYSQRKAPAAAAAAAATDNGNTVTVKAPSQASEDIELLAKNDDRLVPIFDFNEVVPDFDFDEKMFEEGCSIDSILDEIACAPAVDDKRFHEMDVHPLIMEFEVKKELDLVEMFSHAKM